MTDRARRSPGSAVIIEYVVRTRGTTSGTRIFSDGRAEESDDLVQWQELVQIDGEAMNSLLALIRTSGFFELPGSIEPPTPVRDGTTVTWTIDLDGRHHTVTSRDRNPTLQALNDEVQRVVGEALNRAADEGEL